MTDTAGTKSRFGYTFDFGCRDDAPLQPLLNELYEYRDDIETKVLHRLRLNLFVSLMSDLIDRRVIAKYGRALDLGCNAGYYSKLISEMGFGSVVGVDIVEEYVDRAHRHFGSEQEGKRVEFRAGNAEELDTREPFDFILCTEVIEHTQRPQRVIDNIVKVLAPGGTAVVTLPNAASLPYLWAIVVHALKGKQMDPVLKDHVSYPFHRSLGLFRDTGLRVSRTDGTNLVLFHETLKLLYKQPWFPSWNEAHFRAGRLWPFKYFAQFFFMVLEKPST